MFNQNRGAAVFRTIPSSVLSMDSLGMGKVFRDICETGINFDNWPTVQDPNASCND